jgi:FMN phosphatase YigB (HAD superfamily)
MKPEECIFVDDVLENVKAAENLGWTAIHLSDNNSEPAVRQLEKLLSLQIL